MVKLWTLENVLPPMVKLWTLEHVLSQVVRLWILEHVLSAVTSFWTLLATPLVATPKMKTFVSVKYSPFT